ncbi:hypothetical protein M426DRAFT_8974 [Hypoxylon sp. CI-4A]|nr:hypothetical protein M426DRAFT_8974 [Hypoxylon sp. CI-4A]
MATYSRAVLRNLTLAALQGVLSYLYLDFAAVIAARLLVITGDARLVVVESCKELSSARSTEAFVEEGQGEALVAFNAWDKFAEMVQVRPSNINVSYQYRGYWGVNLLLDFCTCAHHQRTGNDNAVFTTSLRFLGAPLGDYFLCQSIGIKLLARFVYELQKHFILVLIGLVDGMNPWRNQHICLVHQMGKTQVSWAWID